MKLGIITDVHNNVIALNIEETGKNFRALKYDDVGKLLAAPESDLHNHSTKGCRRAWLAEQVKFETFLPMYRKAGYYHLTTQKGGL